MESREAKDFWLKYRKIGLGSRGAEVLQVSPAFAAYPPRRLPSVRRGEFIQIFQPDVDFLCQLWICFTAFLVYRALRLRYK
jgi:hypothetical protein